LLHVKLQASNSGPLGMFGERAEEPF